MKLVATGVVGMGALLVLVTALPIVPSNDWWIRMWDFPRIQVSALLVLVLVAVPLTLDPRRRRTWGLAVGVVSALVYQLAWIWPHTPLHPVGVALSASCLSATTIRLLTANVLMTNRRAEPLLEHARHLSPDIVLLVETDRWWDEQLAPVKARYPFVVSEPRGDFYGLHLFSRFELVAPQVRFLIDGYVLSVMSGRPRSRKGEIGRTNRPSAVMSGRPRSRKGEIGRTNRPSAVMSTAFRCGHDPAGHDEVRGSAPNQNFALFAL